MTASPRIATRIATRIRSPHLRSAFTLTELLIVIAIIALLVSLLLAAMTQVQAKGRETRTLATMQAFANACDAFQQEHGFYPGVVPEAILAFGDNSEELTGTENAVLHLMGGFVREEDVGTTKFTSDYDADAGWFLRRFDHPNGGTYRIKVNVSRIGEGPLINGKPYAPYFTPDDDEFAIVEGQLGEDDPSATERIPEILDAWGQPIAYLRRIRSVGGITIDNNGRPQFSGAAMLGYCDSTGLGQLGKNQLFDSTNDAGSVLSTGVGGDNTLNLGKMLEHPALAGQPRGAYLLLSAGRDGLFLSAEDGPGAPGTAVTDVGTRIELPSGNPDSLPPTIFDEYDDVIVFGGGA